MHICEAVSVTLASGLVQICLLWENLLARRGLRMLEFSIVINAPRFTLDQSGGTSWGLTYG